MLKKVEPLSELAREYELILFDIWGVIVEGIPYPGVIDGINKLMQSGRQVRFVSNSMRLRTALNVAMNEIGLKSSSEQFYTSGQMARDIFTNNVGDKQLIYNISNNASLDLVPAGVQTTSNISKATKILFSAQLSTGNDLEIYDDLFKEAISKSIEFICPNPDTIIVNRGSYTYCPGFFAKKYEEFGGKVIYIGKPGRDIFLQAIESANITELSKVLMVGDTLEMDIIGANQLGIASAIVTTGNIGNIAANYDEITQKISLWNEYCERKGIMPKHIVDVSE